MCTLLTTVFLAALLYASTEALPSPSVNIPSDSDLTKAIPVLDESSRPQSQQSQVPSGDGDPSDNSEGQYTNYGQTDAEQQNEELSLRDVLGRKRRAEPSTSTKTEEKLDIPHVDRLPIRDDVSQFVANSNPSKTQDSKPGDTQTEGVSSVSVYPVTFKLASPVPSQPRLEDDNNSNNNNNNNSNNNNRETRPGDDKKDESVKIVISPLTRTTE